MGADYQQDAHTRSPPEEPTKYVDVSNWGVAVKKGCKDNYADRQIVFPGI